MSGAPSGIASEGRLKAVPGLAGVALPKVIENGSRGRAGDADGKEHVARRREGLAAVLFGFPINTRTTVVDATSVAGLRLGVLGPEPRHERSCEGRAARSEQRPRHPVRMDRGQREIDHALFPG